VVGLTLLVFGLLAALRLPPYSLTAEQVQHAVLPCSLGMLFLAALLVAVRCAGVVSGERERQTWDTLLLTPLEPRHILRGKLWGVLDSARVYLVAYLLAALPVTLLLGPWAVFWLVLTWLGAWLAMYFTGAAGIECSARAGNSWRALLAALVSSTWTVVQRFALIAAPIGVASFSALGPAIGGWGAMVFITALSTVLSALFLLAHAEYCLEQAEARVAADRAAQGSRFAKVEEGRPLLDRVLDLGGASSPARR
jgi:ABC-type transport system involved in multi-copper enzyme maturation permease subunit